MSYSVAIRTLGKSPHLETELRQIYAQTVKPEKVIVFIAEGYTKPEFQIAQEEYIFIKKGMASQRLLPYDEIKSDYILMLDDDVMLQPDSLKKLLLTMEVKDADLVGADTFLNHRLPLKTKIKAAVSNLVSPHYSQKWAFKIHRNGSFSYLNNPKINYYPSQSCAGNAMLWKTESYKKLRMQDELWLDSLSFAYGDDMLESYKVYRNGMKLGVVFNSGIKHIDAKSASDTFRKSPTFIKNRTIAQIVVWWRTCFDPGNSNVWRKSFALVSFIVKMGWQFFLFLILSLYKLNFSYLSNFIKGIAAGWKFVHSEPFRSLPPYVVR